MFLIPQGGRGPFTLLKRLERCAYKRLESYGQSPDLYLYALIVGVPTTRRAQQHHPASWAPLHQARGRFEGEALLQWT